ncbi:MAG: FAD-dependent oxidoreductase, partial [Pseudomonadota bacterium]
VDLAIVGAGPTGLVAAAEAATLGLRTVVLDENSSAGGQAWRGATAPGPRARSLTLADATANATLAEAERHGAEFRLGASVWDISGDGILAYARDGRSQRLQAAAVLLCPGAKERPVPFPGWTLPGVMGAGALQSVVKTGGIVPAMPWALAGSGPLALLVLAQLVELDAPPVVVLDTTPQNSLQQSLRHLPAAVAAQPDLVLSGLRLLWRRRRSGVRVVAGVQRLEALGRDQIEAVIAHHRHGSERFEVGLLAVHEGVVPRSALPRLLGVPHRWNDLRRSFEPEVDTFGRVAGRPLWVAGDAAAVEGEVASRLRGRLAAIDIAGALDRIRDGNARKTALLHAHRRQQKLRRFLDRLYPAPRPTIADDVVVCRCERVTAGEIRGAVAAGAHGPNRVKAATRCGMGLCQGRMCGLALTELIAEATGRSPADVGSLRIRPPLKPIRLDELAALDA